ncbi:MAG: pyridoxal phosphate-dependent aminotransferase [Prevotella sp.]|nr:pyridoxal phosphate-dependent aminotransferase [Prevotella sp.]
MKTNDTNQTPLPSGGDGGGFFPSDEAGAQFNPIVRRGTHCYKWDEAEEEDIIPMWVADMDFCVAPAIQQAVERRARHGVYGYTLVDESYYEAIISWFSRRHHWTIDRQSILYTTGVVPAVSCAIKALAMPGEQVVIMSPVYNCFYSSIKNNGCIALESPLREVDGRWEIDWTDLEAKLAEEKSTILLLCNPHNPTGRLWTRDELERVNELCIQNGVRVVSDEIHCELVMPGHTFQPFATVSEACRRNSVILNSPSKSFNTAGLQIANIICDDPAMRRRINRAININEVCDVNPFGPEALKAAYNESEDWLDALNQYLFGNYQRLCSWVSEEHPELRVAPLEGTYLAWVDIRALGCSSDELTERLLHEAHVQVSSGTLYGRQTGEGFIRLNLACPRSQLDEALRRIGACLS